MQTITLIRKIDFTTQNVHKIDESLNASIHIRFVMSAPLSIKRNVREKFNSLC